VEAEVSKKKAAYRLIFNVFIGLAVLTVLEFLVTGWTDGSAPILLIIALAKAGLIVNYFMHIYRLWREESH
jgi:caa(3)-type oxidase subunit IV